MSTKKPQGSTSCQPHSASRSLSPLAVCGSGVVAMPDAAAAGPSEEEDRTSAAALSEMGDDGFMIKERPLPPRGTLAYYQRIIWVTMEDPSSSESVRARGAARPNLAAGRDAPLAASAFSPLSMM